MLRVAVDIGGTFTDTVLMAGDGAILSTTKTATTPDNPTLGALEGVRYVLNDTGKTFGEIGGFIHGTTLATNALIERRGARVSTITTAGFRDILEIAYERRYSQYDINLDKPDLIVPRSRAFTIRERMTARGDMIEPLDTGAIDALVDQLDQCETEAVAICLLHAYANPLHEEQLRTALARKRPRLTISISSEISPEAREFERLCTTIANAYIQPLMGSYLREFARQFADEGMTCPILMMTAGGGMTTIETAAIHPIRLVESGPAGGAILAARIAEATQSKEVLSFDMGGTTAKLCLIDHYKPQHARKFEIARAARFIKGSGMPVRIPVLEMIEIGAGGGSIAEVNSLGTLQVGPQSAGSEPGPAAFGKGGEEATVTDSDVMLGYIDPKTFAEGRIAIDRELAASALEKSVGASLELSPLAAAFGVSEIVDEAMASAGRMHAVESGKDLSSRLMIAFGGNGPLHATRVARRAGINRILIPTEPGVGSAVGFLFAPVSFELVRSKYATLDHLPIDELNRFFSSMIGEAQGVVRAAALNLPLECRRTAFMRYHGQGHEIEISLPDRALIGKDIERIKADFETEYSRQFSRAVPGMKIEILNWSVRVSTTGSPASNSAMVSKRSNPGPVSHRRIQCDVTNIPVEVPVFERAKLVPGDTISGPALIVEPQTTTLVSVDFELGVDSTGNLILDRIGTRKAVQ